jgi:hypothetical protein
MLGKLTDNEAECEALRQKEMDGFVEKEVERFNKEEEFGDPLTSGEQGGARH